MDGAYEAAVFANLNVLRKTAVAADFDRRLSFRKKRFSAALNPQRPHFKCCCPAHAESLD